MTDEANTEVAVEEEKEAVKDKGPKMKKKVSGVSKESKLTVIATENNKRGASAARFQAYLDKKPATVQEALDAGLTMGDIHYDHIHGSIDVEGAVVEEYEPKARGPRDDTAGDAGDAGDAEASAEPEVTDDGEGF